MAQWQRKRLNNFSEYPNKVMINAKKVQKLVKVVNGKTPNLWLIWGSNLNWDLSNKEKEKGNE